MPIDHPLPLQQLRDPSGISALLSNYYDALWRELEHLSIVEESVAIDTVAQLLAMARGAMSPEDERGEDTLRQARLQLARDYIEANLHDTKLSPAMVASAPESPPACCTCSSNPPVRPSRAWCCNAGSSAPGDCS